ncbi:MAG TPA: hypothetical protein VGD59_11640 [Acidisarcina sp.]
MRNASRFRDPGALLTSDPSAPGPNNATFTPSLSAFHVQPQPLNSPSLERLPTPDYCGDQDAPSSVRRGRQFHGLAGKLAVEGIFLRSLTGALGAHIADCWRYRKLY